MPNVIEQSRRNMIESQVRTWEVLDARVLEALAVVPREDFVPARHRALAFADLALPLDHGEVMLKPVIEGRLLQALDLRPEDRVLEIGTGTGFLTACIARLAGSVVSIELHPDLADAARARLAAAGVRNARVEAGDGIAAPPSGDSFDVVVLGGGVWSIPDRVRACVRPGGRLFAFVGESPVLQATLATRADATHWTSQSILETDLPYLHGAEPPRRFTL